MGHLDLRPVDHSHPMIAAPAHPAPTDHGDRMPAEVQGRAARVVDGRLVQHHGRTAHGQHPMSARRDDLAAAGGEAGGVGGLQAVATGSGDPAVDEFGPRRVGEAYRGPCGRVDPALGDHGLGIVLDQEAVAPGVGQGAVERQQPCLAADPQRGTGDAPHPQPFGQQYGGAGEHRADAVDLRDQRVLDPCAGVAGQVQGGVAGVAERGAAQQQDAAAVDGVGQFCGEVGVGCEARVGHRGGARRRADDLDTAAVQLALLKRQRRRVLDPDQRLGGVGAAQHQSGEHAVGRGDGDGGSGRRADDHRADAALGFQDDPAGEPERLRVLAGFDADDRGGGGGQRGRDGPVGSPAFGGHAYHRHAGVPPFEPSTGWV